MTPDLDGLIERLRRREQDPQMFMMIGGQAPFYLVNPDGPEAAAALTQARDDIAELREALREARTELIWRGHGSEKLMANIDNALSTARIDITEPTAGQPS